MTGKTLILILVLMLIVLLFQACKQKPIMPENIYVLKGYDYSDIKVKTKIGKFTNDKEIEKEQRFSEIVKRKFSKAGFVFNSGVQTFVLEGELLKFNESESTDIIYTDVEGISIPIEDTNTSYDISFNLLIKNIKTGKKIWSCKISDSRETDYPVPLIKQMIKACLKTIK